MRQGQVVLVDTNIIIEAFRARCWKALTAYYRVETVEKCYEEALTGDRLRPGYVEVDPAALKGKLVIHRVASMELAALALTCPDADGLDAGERHLFAHAHGRADAWITTCADRAAVRVALVLGWKDHILFAGGTRPPHGRETGAQASFYRGVVVAGAHRFHVGEVGMNRFSRVRSQILAY